MKIIKEQNNNLHNIYIGFYFHGGVLYENNKVREISHLLEHMFFRKMNDISQRDLYKSLNKIGVTLNGYTYKDYICFGAGVLSEYFNDFIDIIINLYEDFKWNEDEIKVEKEVVKRQIEEKGYSYFDDIVNDNYYEGSCFKNKIAAKVHNIENLSDNVINDYKKRIFNKDNSIIVLTGNFQDKNVNYLSEKLNQIKDFSFKKLKRQNTIPKKFCKRDDKNIIIMQSDYDVNDIEIRIDLREDVDMDKAEMLFHILAVGDGAKIPYRLKDYLGYIGDFDCNFNYYKDFNLVTLGCSVDNKYLIKTLNIIFDEINKIKKEISNEDIEENIIFMTDYSNIIDSTEDYNDLLAYERFILGNSDFSIQNKTKSFEKITVKDLKKTAKQIFKKKNISVYVENNSKMKRKYKVFECIENNLGEI